MLSKFAIGSLLLIAHVEYATAEDVRLASWPEYGKNAGIIFAQESGLYGAHGLETTVIDTFQNGLILLEAGEADIAQVFCSAALSSIGEGLAGKIIAVRDQNNPVATIAKREKGITSPAHYAGKRWGHSSGFSPERQMLSDLMRINGSSIDSIELVNLEFPARLPALLADEVDFVSAWVGSGLPSVMIAARKAGAELDVLRWDDFGVDVYGECYVARLQPDGTLPQWVGPWLAATKEGHILAVSDPKVVGDVVLAAVLQAGDPEAFWLALEQGNELLLAPEMEAEAILSVDRHKLSETARWAGLDVGIVDRAVHWSSNID